MQIVLQQLGYSQADFEMLQSIIGVLFVITLVSLVLTPWLARRKKLKVGYWSLMAVLFGPFALIAILFVPAKPSSVESAS